MAKRSGTVDGESTINASTITSQLTRMQVPRVHPSDLVGRQAVLRRPRLWWGGAHCANGARAEPARRRIG